MTVTPSGRSWTAARVGAAWRTALVSASRTTVKRTGSSGAVVPVTVDLDAELAHPADQRVEAAGGGPVLERDAQLAKGPARDVRQRGERAARGRLVACPTRAAPRLGLQHDHRQAVGDGVVQLARDAQPLRAARPRRVRPPAGSSPR